jgi:hypothetical protein
MNGSFTIFLIYLRAKVKLSPLVTKNNIWPIAPAPNDDDYGKFYGIMGKGVRRT